MLDPAGRKAASPPRHGEPPGPNSHLDRPELSLLEWPCPICGSNGDKVVLQSEWWNESEQTYHPWKVRRCTECGFVSSKLRPASRLGDAYLTSEFYCKEMWQTTDSGDFSGRLAELLNRPQVTFANLMLQRVSVGRLLDIGCGRGDFLRRMNGRGWTVDGVELDPTYCRLLSREGITVYPGEFESLELPEKSYDVLVMFEVLEHVSDPVHFLMKAKKVLRPGGLLLLSTPNIKGLRAAVEHGYWTGVHPPFHLSFFDKDTLTSTLGLAGFQLETIYSGSTFLSTLLGLVGGANRLVSARRRSRPSLPREMLSAGGRRRLILHAMVLGALLIAVPLYVAERLTGRGNSLYAAYRNDGRTRYGSVEYASGLEGIIPL